MAFTPGSNEGSSNDTTVVTVVAAPASGVQRQISQIQIYNGDTASAIVNIEYDTGGTNRRMVRKTMVVGETLTLGGYVLDATNKLIELVLDAAVATNQLTFSASYADVSP